MAPSSKGAVAGGDGGALPALGLPGMASSSARTAAGHGRSPWSTSQLTVPPQILFAGGLMLEAGQSGARSQHLCWEGDIGWQLLLSLRGCQPPEHSPTTLVVPHSLCQEQLPATGVPITRQRFDHMRRMFDEYVRSSTLQNWKFWIVSFGASACCSL